MEINTFFLCAWHEYIQKIQCIDKKKRNEMKRRNTKQKIGNIIWWFLQINLLHPCTFDITQYTECNSNKLVLLYCTMINQKANALKGRYT